MRILASNPDTLGDLILRQPLYSALLAAGHELTLIVRPAVAPLVTYVAPGASVIELKAEPYADDLLSEAEAIDQTLRAAVQARPELLVISPYRWTRFDERLAAALVDVKRVGMSGHLYGGNPHAGKLEPSSMRFDIVADVNRDDREVLKNAVLAGVILGSALPSNDPALVADNKVRARATEILERLGLESGGYWIACVSGTAHVPLKAWPVQHWGELFRRWTDQSGTKFLFIGTDDERSQAEAVCIAMGGAAEQRTRIWMPEGGTIDELIGLTALSRGYVGHDTGPMHVAAALSKPVLGVFGGGHGMRFAPAIDQSIAIVVGVPCMNCGWICPFTTSHCVKQIPVDEVLRAALDLETGRAGSREARLLDPGAALLSRMVEESTEVARTQLREAVERGKLLTASDQARQAEVSAGRERASRAESDAVALRAVFDQMTLERDAARTAVEKTTSRLGVIAGELDVRTHQLAVKTGELQRAQSAADQNATEAAAVSALLRKHVHGIDRLTHRTAALIERRPALNGHDPAPASDVPEADPEPVARLSSQIARLGSELQTLRPRERPPMKHSFVHWLIGRKEYRVRQPRPLPRITIILPTLNAATHLRETLDSVVSQNYSNIEFIVIDGGSTDGTERLLEEYRPHIGLLIAEADTGAMDAVAKGLNYATGDVLHLLYAGDVLEAGALIRVAAEFGRRPRVQAIYYEDTITYPDGWRFEAPRQPAIDVMSLLGSEAPFRNGVFFRRRAYERIGRWNLSVGRAADWDLWLRLERRFGIRRVRGNVRSIRPTSAESPGATAFRRDLPLARKQFQRTFGAAGRFRCAVLNLVHRVSHCLEGPRQGLLFSIDPGGQPLPPGEAPRIVSNEPICPLSNRHPDRLLFSTRDTNGGDRRIHYVYYDSVFQTAVTYPPMSTEELDRLYAAQAAPAPRPIITPDQRYASPFKRFRRASLGDLLMRLRCPYWVFRKPDFGNTSAATLLRITSRDLSAEDASARVLVVGCFDGTVLQALSASTRWTVRGTETSAQAAGVARGNGFTVWETPPLQAPLAIPIDEQFNLIYLDGQIEHCHDPVVILRRLRQLLLPGGKIVINQPNLDSRHVEIFGPTWVHWQTPFHRVLMGRRGVRRLARLAGLRVMRMTTITHPYRTCGSVQLRDLGLGAVVPTDALFPDDVALRGINLAGWSRLLWDWRGRGDYLYAVMEMR